MTPGGHFTARSELGNEIDQVGIPRVERFHCTDLRGNFTT